MDNLNLQHVGDSSVNHSPLKPKPRGTMTLPLTSQCFVVKPLDGSQPLRPGKPGNVFPFLVTFQNLHGYGARKLFVDATVLFNVPHAALCIYHKWYVKGDDCPATHNEAVEKLFSCPHSAVNQME
jgi:hypothetical protein